MGDTEVLQQPRRRQPNPILHAVPTTVDRSRPFLDRLQFDLSHWGNSAGNIQQGQVSLDLRPVRFSLGMGRLHLDRLNNDLFTVSPRVDINGVVGRTNLFGSLGFAIVPGNSEVRTSVFQEGEFGLTYDIIAEQRRNGYFLRIGADLAAVGEGRYPFVPTGQGYVHTGIGVSAGFGPITVYGTARATIAPDTPIQQNWDDALRLHPLEATGGVVANLGPAIISAEYLYGIERQRGTLGVRLPTIPLSPEVRLSYSHNQMPLFGDLDQFTAGITLNLDAPRGVRRVTFRADQGVDFHSQRTAAQRSDVATIGIHLVTIMPHLLNAIGAINDFQEHDALRQIAQKLDYVDYYSLPATETAIWILNSRLTTQQQQPGVREQYILQNLARNFLTSNTLDELAQRYSSASSTEIITVAAILASLGGRYYNNSLAGASIFGDRSESESLNPNSIYSGFQQLFRTGSMNAGICANINGFAAEFLRRTGLEAYSVSIGSGSEMHIIALARDPRTNTNYLVNYGEIYRSQGNSVLPVLQDYAAASGLLILGIDLFGEHNQHIGHYQTPEGELTEHMTTGRDRGARLRGALIRRREE